MKTLLLTIFTGLFAYQTSAQKLNWVKRQSSANNDQTNSIANDKQGNIISVGTFDATASFGSFNLTTNGSLDIFIAKYDSMGNCLWAKKAGGSFGDEGTFAAVDNQNNIYVTGNYGQAGATFESTFVGSLGGLKNGFLAKYRSDGTLIWVKTIGGMSSSPLPNRIAVTNNGKVYLAGAFYGNVTFNGTTPLAINSSAGGRNDIFIAQYDTAGQIGWVNSGGDRKDEAITGLTLDNAGNPIIYGSYDSLTTFNGTTKYAESFGSASGFRDLFVVKYSSMGGSLWFQSFGGGDDDEAGGICVDENDNIYTTGFFRRNFKAANGINENNSGTANTLFLFKLQAAGIPVWIKYSVASFSENSGWQKGNALYYYKQNIFLAGHFGNKFKFGNTVFSGGGDTNPMLLKYDSSGNALWGSIAKTTGLNISLGLTVTAFNNTVYYGGYLKGAVTFNDSIYTAPGVYSDGFICSIKDESTIVYNVPNPTLLVADSLFATSIRLRWDGTSPEFRVVAKIGSSSTNKDDGILVYEGSNKSFNLSGLLPSKPYFYTVWGKEAGINNYSSGNKKLAAATLPVLPTDPYIISVLASDTFSRVLPGASLSFGMQSPSATDGWIKANVFYNLTSVGTVPVGIDSIFTNQYWTITNNGLTGSSMRFCIKILLTTLLGPSVDTANYTLLRRNDSLSTWENVQTNPAYSVTYDLPQSIRVCNLSTLGEFVIAKKQKTTGIKEKISQSFHFYPNPSHKTIRFETTKPFTQNIVIFSLNGAQMMEQPALGNYSVELNHESLSPGMYLIRVEGIYFKHIIAD